MFSTYLDKKSVITWSFTAAASAAVKRTGTFSETEVMLKAVKNAREWQDSNAKSKSKINSDSPKDYSTRNTQPQPQVSPFSFLCYSDAAWNGVSQTEGLGWICYDPWGATVFQGTQSYEAVNSVLVAETKALKAGLKAAIAQGIKDMVCLSDSKCLINLITGNKSVISLQGILHDITVLSASLSSISFVHVSRLCNSVADGLAKAALFSAQSDSV